MNDPETECIVMIGEIGGQLMLPSLKADGNRKPGRFHRRVTVSRSYHGSWCNRWWI
jgi:hypothetical protein